MNTKWAFQSKQTKN